MLKARAQAATKMVLVSTATDLAAATAADLDFRVCAPGAEVLAA